MRTTAAILVVFAATLLLMPSAEAKKGCPDGMRDRGKYCIDAYEASVVEIDERGKAHPHPHYEPVTDVRVRAQSKKGVFPQGYISRNEAEDACHEAKKRLCTDEEWVAACKGKHKTRYPYGDERIAKACNDTDAVSPMNKYYGEETPEHKYTWGNMNDPRLNQLAGGLLRTGTRAKCKTTDKVFDMVGNLHEWTADVRGTFRGGYYLDTEINGEGCDYKTTAHDANYHDYSTGFRCCKSQ